VLTTTTTLTNLSKNPRWYPAIRRGREGGERTQTLYAHINKINKKIKKREGHSKLLESQLPEHNF
jgi:hypothetical protein